ncbi:uncharacterized protein J3D65DRAFT_659028 [Phyllosticta citribraziliensis]|uniref:Uncharacterized protein n=1 Tax=Phyllosticta citribraziliensis TaxID=989973 RepID=A0ABR1LKV5_9PEZI
MSRSSSSFASDPHSIQSFGRFLAKFCADRTSFATTRASPRPSADQPDSIGERHLWSLVLRFTVATFLFSKSSVHTLLFSNMEETVAFDATTVPGQPKTTQIHKSMWQMFFAEGLSLCSSEDATMPYGRINRVRLDHRFNKYENEASVAAYLLFMDQAAFRQFMLSYPILDAFRTWKEHGGFNTRIEDAFELLRGASNSEDIFPPSMEEIVKKYRRPQNDEIPEDNKFDFCPIRSRWSYRKNIREDWLLAALLRHLVQCMGDALSCTPDEEKVKLQKIANSKFADSLGLQTPITHQITDVIQPVWGPFETFGEEPFEEYNRAYMVLRRLMHVVQTDGLWAFEFLCDQPFRSCITPRDAIPWWMLGPKSPGALEQPLPVPVELPSCNYRIRISQHGSIMEQQLQKHEEAFLKPRGLRLPRSDEIIRCQADPRLFEERDDFLDALRMQLNLAKMRVSFSAVRLYLRNQGRSDIYGQQLWETWSEIQACMAKSSDGVFEYMLKVLPREVDGSLHSQTSPLALSSLIRVRQDPCRSEYKRRVEEFVRAIWETRSVGCDVDGKICRSNESKAHPERYLEHVKAGITQQSRKRYCGNRPGEVEEELPQSQPPPTHHRSTSTPLTACNPQRSHQKSQGRSRQTLLSPTSSAFALVKSCLGATCATFTGIQAPRYILQCLLKLIALAGQVQVNSAPWRSLYPPGLPPAPATTPENSSADHSLLKASAARNSISAVSPTRINPRDLSIRFTQYRNESAVSAYVLSSDVGKFRRFLLSYPVLDAFCVWKKEGGLNTDIEAALKLLDRTQPLDEAFPVEIHAIFAKYGKQFDENGESVEDFDFWDEHDTHGRQIHVLASVLRHPVVCSGPIIENGDKYHPFAFQFFQPIANGEFRNSTGRSIPVLHDHTKPHSFNRQPISVADVPFWMRSIGNTMVQLQDLVIRKSPGDPPQIYTLRCASKTSAYSTLLERLAASLEAHDYLELPDEFPVPCQPDPGDFETIGQFLNAVAAQLNLAKLGLQFHTVHLLLEDDFKTQLHPNTGNRTWPEIQELIASEPSAEFEYTLRPLGHD